MASTISGNSTNPKDAFGRQKPGITNIPPVALIHEAMAMKNGADKYGPFNWRNTTVSSRVYQDAMFRHLIRFLDGENFDPETGVHHLGHLRASAGILLDAAEQGTLIDDRPMPGHASEVLERLTKRAEEASPHFDIPPVEPTPSRRQRRCYIAGPMRGLPKFNFPAFDAARNLARSKGWDPISPADIDRENGINEDTQVESKTFDDKARVCREFVTRDVAALVSLRAEYGDAIALLPGWKMSTGARAEFFVARWLQLGVLNAVTMLPFTTTEILALDANPILRSIEAAMCEKHRSL